MTTGIPYTNIHSARSILSRSAKGFIERKYTAKGTAALLVPAANYMQQSSGNWDSVFLIAAGANVLASLLAIAVLKPWRKVVVSKAMA